MSASSVTGIGPGSAEPNNKGSERMTLGSPNHLIGVRVMLVGRITLSDGGTGTVTFAQPLEVAATDHHIFLQGDSSTVAYPSSFTVNGFSITGGADDIVDWMIVHK